MLRLDDDEYRGVLEQAKAVDLPPAVFVRHCVLSRKITPKATRKIYAKYINQLSWIGNNINQIARALNLIKNNTESSKKIDLITEMVGINLTLNDIKKEIVLLENLIKKDSEN